MNKILRTKFIISLCAVALFWASIATTVHAATPYLQVTTSDNINFQITVTGADSFRSVDLHTKQTDTQMWTVYTNIGTTDQNGYLRILFPINSNIPNLGRESYVEVNGQISSIVSSNNFIRAGEITFSQSNLALTVGQSKSVNVYGGSGYGYNISSNSNSYAVSASISGNLINLYANAVGNGTITICSNYSYPYYNSICGYLYFTVSSSGSGNIWFEPSNPSLYVGQSLAVSINSGSSSYTYPSTNAYYYVSNNTNPAAVSASVSGSVLNLYANQNGTSYITVNHSSLGWSKTISVTVTGSVYNASTYPNGQLLNYNGTIYIVYKNTVTGFTNANAFLGLGYRFDNAQYTSYLETPISTYVVRSSQTFHPWGSWVKSGQTIYFVHESGLIPIPSYDIFLNNGGQDYLVVSMNSYDWQLTKQSLMTYNDYRLK